MICREDDMIYDVPSPTSLMPENKQIVGEAIKSVPKEKTTSKYIEKNFYEVLKLLMQTGYDIFLDHQQRAKNKTVDIFNSKTSKLEPKKRDMALLQLGVEFERSASQMRKARAGQALENYVQKLLELMNIPCEKPSGNERDKLNRTDLVVPDKATAFKQPDKAKFISIKTTLAERWKQVVPEQNRGWAVYLLTLDDKLSVKKANEIDKSGIVLFVPDGVKSRKEIKDIDGIRKLSDLPEHLSHYKKK